MTQCPHLRFSQKIVGMAVRNRSPGAPTKTHLELCNLEVEQFLAMLRFEQRDKLEELPIDQLQSIRDDFF